MTNLSVPYAFVSGSAIVASEMNANFDAVKTLVNTTGVPKIQDDAVTADAIASGAVGYAELHASQRHEPGDLKWSARETAQSGWLLCDGSAVSRSTYAALFAAIGTTYGSGDGSTTFNIPDARGRTLIAPDDSAGRVTTNNTRGATGGAATHTLVIGEMPTHTHVQDAHTHGIRVDTSDVEASFTAGGGWLKAHNAKLGRLNSGSADIVVSSGGAREAVTSTTATNQNTGGDGAHNNMQPYTVGNLFIKT